MSASLAAISRGSNSGFRGFASCSNSPIRPTLIPGGPISRIAVAHAPERRTPIVTLSSVRLTDIASKPILRAITCNHSRVRMAVFPARIIEAPIHASVSTASFNASEAALFSRSKDEVTLGL